jgi:AcrR family transcriptional regulator
MPAQPDGGAAAPRRKARLTSAGRRALLEDAACACMARGGIRAFTVDKVAAEAGVSRGLIVHHFGSMDGLLVAVYSRMYGEWIAAISAPRPGLGRLEAIVEALVSPALFCRDVQNTWLTLWGEIANNPVLGAEHRLRYAEYRDSIAGALREAGVAGAGRDPDTVATALICLIDGLGVQRCVEPALLPEAAARAAFWALLDPLRCRGASPARLGPKPAPDGARASPT